VSIQIQTIQAAKASVNNRRRDMKSFAEHPNLDLRGKAVVVLGSSPALNEVDLSVLDDVVTIGINRICEVYDPTALLFTDPPIYYVAQDDYDRFKGPILTWHGLSQDIGCVSKSNARYFNLQPASPDPKAWRWPASLSDPLIREGTTPPYAVQLAVLAGAKAVGILGVDHSAPDRSQRKQETHFFGTARMSWFCRACKRWLGDKPVIQRNRSRVCPYDDCRSENRLMRLTSTGGSGWLKSHDVFYRGCLPWANARGVELVNLSPFADTPIHRSGWPKLSVEDFVSTYG
jgi:hypothetical protein